MSIEKASYQKFNTSKISYTLISNNVVRNIKCATSYQVYSYLQSQSENWAVSKEHISNLFSLSAHKVKAIFSYLKRCNLVEYVRERNECGTFLETKIIVKDGTEFDSNEPFLRANLIAKSSKSQKRLLVKITSSVKNDENKTIEIQNNCQESENEMDIKDYFVDIIHDAIDQNNDTKAVDNSVKVYKNQTHRSENTTSGIYIYKNKNLVSSKTNELVCESTQNKHDASKQKSSIEFNVCDTAKSICKNKNLDFNFVMTKFINFYKEKEFFANASEVKKNCLLIKWINSEKQHTNYSSQSQQTNKNYNKSNSESRCTVKFFDEIEKEAPNPYVQHFGPGNPAYDRLMQHNVVFDVRKQLREKRERKEKSA